MHYYLTSTNESNKMPQFRIVLVCVLYLQWSYKVSVKHFKQSITWEVCCTCNGVIQYQSVKHFKPASHNQGREGGREGGRLSGIHLVIDQLCYRFHTCKSGSEPLLNTELSIEYARFQPP